jgi:hypothetical protein
MRILGAILTMAVGFALASVALKSQPSEADNILAINRAEVARHAFVTAWIDWDLQHDRYKTSKRDRVLSKLMFSRFKEFRRLYEDAER